MNLSLVTIPLTACIFILVLFQVQDDQGSFKLPGGRSVAASFGASFDGDGFGFSQSFLAAASCATGKGRGSKRRLGRYLLTRRPCHDLGTLVLPPAPE